MEDPAEVSESHLIAVVKLDNGELAEAVVAREIVEDDEKDEDQDGRRIVHSYPVPADSDGADPENPRPGTLPKTTPPT